MPIRRCVARAALLILAVLSAPVPAWASAPEWNIDRVNAPASAAGIVIAVVDTGVDAAHPVLAGRVLPELDFVGDGKNGDPHGHGTHVAGTAAGADAGCGNIGVAPDATILPVRVLDEEGSGSIGDVAEGIRAAADAGAIVINLSLGTDVALRPVANSGFSAALDYAWSKGSIPVLAAGNDTLLGGLFGSGYGGIKAIVVTATDPEDRKPSYATRIGSADWGIAAPGGDDPMAPGRGIVSSWPDGQCASLIGTSMAAPHVSAAVAALRAAGYGQQQAVDRVLATARDLGSSGTFGAGLLDVRAAVGQAPTTTGAPSTPAPTSPVPPTPAPSSSSPTPTVAPRPSPAPTTATSANEERVDPETTTTGAPRISVGPTDTAVDDADASAAPTPGAVTVVDVDDGRPPATLVLVATSLLVATSAGVWFTLRSR